MASIIQKESRKRKADEISTKDNKPPKKNGKGPLRKKRKVSKTSPGHPSTYLRPDEKTLVFGETPKNALMRLAIGEYFSGLVSVKSFHTFCFLKFANDDFLKTAIEAGEQSVRGCSMKVSKLEPACADGNGISSCRELKILTDFLKPHFNSLKFVSGADTDHVKLHFADSTSAQKVIASGVVKVSGIKIHLKAWTLQHRKGYEIEQQKLLKKQQKKIKLNKKKQLKKQMMMKTVEST